MQSNISLREYVDARFNAQSDAVSAALEAAKEATEKAEAASEKRFEGVNEFRAALADNSRLLMPRAECERAFGALGDKIDALTIRLNARDDRGQGMSVMWGIIIGVVGIATAIVALLYRR